MEGRGAGTAGFWGEGGSREKIRMPCKAEGATGTAERGNPRPRLPTPERRGTLRVSSVSSQILQRGPLIDSRSTRLGIGPIRGTGGCEKSAAARARLGGWATLPEASRAPQMRRFFAQVVPAQGVETAGFGSLRAVKTETDFMAMQYL